MDFFGTLGTLQVGRSIANHCFTESYEDRPLFLKSTHRVSGYVVFYVFHQQFDLQIPALHEALTEDYESIGPFTIENSPAYDFMPSLTVIFCPFL